MKKTNLFLIVIIVIVATCMLSSCSENSEFIKKGTVTEIKSTPFRTSSSNGKVRISTIGAKHTVYVDGIPFENADITVIPSEEILTKGMSVKVYKYREKHYFAVKNARDSDVSALIARRCTTVLVFVILIVIAMVFVIVFFDYFMNAMDWIDSFKLPLLVEIVLKSLTFIIALAAVVCVCMALTWLIMLLL